MISFFSPGVFCTPPSAAKGDIGTSRREYYVTGEYNIMCHDGYNVGPGGSLWKCENGVWTTENDCVGEAKHSLSAPPPLLRIYITYL